MVKLYILWENATLLIYIMTFSQWVEVPNIYKISPVPPVDMKRGRRVGLLTLLMGLFLGLSMVQGAAAATDWLDIAIDHASYHDLDGDGFEDDIQTDFTFTVAHGVKCPGKSEYYFTLTLPSGSGYLVILTIIGKFQTLQLSLLWYDCATESGWYNIQVDAFTQGGPRLGHSTNNLDFDPPSAGGGDPHVKIFIL
jgi:hypothetical protein